MPLGMPERYDKPQCCKTAEIGNGVFWETEAHGEGHEPGWTMVKDVVIEIRSYYLMNVAFCPFCGTKLPDS